MLVYVGEIALYFIFKGLPFFQDIFDFFKPPSSSLAMFFNRWSIKISLLRFSYQRCVSAPTGLWDSVGFLPAVCVILLPPW